MRYEDVRRAAEQLAHEVSDEDQIKLMRKWLQDHPHHPSPYDVVVVPRFISVWVLIAHVQGSHGDICQVAHDYEIPVDAVQAALAYYLRFPEAIEARIDANEEISYLKTVV